MKKNLLTLFLPIFLVFLSATPLTRGNMDDIRWTYEDENIVISVEVNQRNIIEAVNTKNAIRVNPEGEFILTTNYTAVGEHPVNITDFKVTLTLFDISVYSYSEPIDVLGQPGEPVVFNQSFFLDDYLTFGDVKSVSGIYKLKVGFNYVIQEQEQALSLEPFYVKMDVNPLVTVTGIITTAGVASAGYWLYQSSRMVTHLQTGALYNPIDSSSVFPTDQLLNFLKGEYTDRLQSEFGQKLINNAKQMWKKQKCPSCTSTWSLSNSLCPGCGITLELAEEIFSNQFVSNVLNAGEELSGSVSGLQLFQISQGIGQGLDTTTDIVSFLAVSGLGMIEPRLGKKMSETTRTLLFTGVYIVVVSFFWIQAMGIQSMSLLTLILGIIAGILLPLLISNFLKNRTRSKVTEFWDEKQSEIKIEE